MHSLYLTSFLVHNSQLGWGKMKCIFLSVKMWCLAAVSKLTHPCTQIRPWASTVQCIFSTVTLQDGGFVGGRAKRRQAAGRENLSHRHLTKSHRSSFSCRQKKNGDDGQAEQNEVKVILFKRGDRYSRSVCICTCVRVGAFFYRACQSAGKRSCSDMTAGQVSLSSDTECVRACVFVCVSWGTIQSLESMKRWEVEKFTWSKTGETYAPILKHLQTKKRLKFKQLNKYN